MQAGLSTWADQVCQPGMAQIPAPKMPPMQVDCYNQDYEQPVMIIQNGTRMPGESSIPNSDST